MLGFSPRNESYRKQLCNEALLFTVNLPERGTLLRLGTKDEDGKSTVFPWGRRIPGGASRIPPPHCHQNQAGGGREKAGGGKKEETEEQ